jgi:hypothetical protein
MRQFFLFFLFFSFGPLCAQFAGSLYYYADGERLSLQRDMQTLVIHFPKGEHAKAERITLPGLNHVEIHDAHGRAIFHLNRPVEQADIAHVRASFGSTPVYSMEHGLLLSDGFFMALTHEVVAVFKKGISPGGSAVTAIAARYGAEYKRDEYGTSIFYVTDPIQGLFFANALVEGQVVQWAHPDFYAKVTRYNDPFFGQQFQMSNTGQVVNGWAGVPGIDCNALPAWAITTGASNITVALIDDGLEAHEDLVDVSNLTRVLGGNTPATGGNGTPRYSSDGHGMACAGILAATHNNAKGVRGVAPEVRLRSVNIFWGGETTQQIANGINWARTQGVAVMSNSWGYNSCTVSYSNLNSALSSARTNGRGGLGCIVVFAAGNGGKTCIDYPANRPDVIAVGSVTNLGAHSNYSNRGPQLSLVAPSDPDFGQSGAFVRTIDRMGSAGYNSGNYEAFFGGTSAACPVVAGVAALLIAVNPGITEAAARSIMQSTATDMGTTGFDNTFGHGRINAGAAVVAAAPPPPPPPPGCTLNELQLTITLDDNPEETTWSISDFLGNTLAQGGPYATAQAAATIQIPLCLEDGCYLLNFSDASGDGMCCTWGPGSYTLTGPTGAVLATGGQFGFFTSQVFCAGEVSEPASCSFLNFNGYSIVSYGGGGIDVGTFEVQDGGFTLFQQNNSLRAIVLNYPVTANTVLEFQFRSTQQAQMHGIGFNNNNQLNPSRIFKIFGTQDFGAITDFATYSGTEFVQYSIPVGQYYSGSNLSRLFFLTGNYTGNPRGRSFWRNVRVYESGQCTPALVTAQPEDFMEDLTLFHSNRSHGYALFPNPSKGEVTLLAPNGETVQQWSVFDLHGRLVATERTAHAQVHMQLGRLETGVYLVEWKTELGQLHRERLVIAR